jgi:glycosyltransferase involved in cell wall biosynthesis
MDLSVVVPAYNEEALLPSTLSALAAAQRALEAVGGVSEIVVVDNDSRDRTPLIAQSFGVQVLTSHARSIGAVRNEGAAATTGRTILFLDADTLVPPTALAGLAELMQDQRIAGGALATIITPQKRSLRPYLEMWKFIADRCHMAQGIAQFVRRDVFAASGGFDERFVMAEDIDFYWRLQRLATDQSRRIEFVREFPVIPSTRRLDAWPVWKTIVWGNPLVTVPVKVRALRRILESRRIWRAWYVDPIR